MKNTNSKEYKATVKAYLTPIIIDALEARELPIDGNIFLSILGVAKSEVKHEFDRNGDHAGLTHWLAGLGMGIDFTNYDIITLAQSWHDCELTEKQKDVILERWFSHIAWKIIQFSR